MPNSAATSSMSRSPGLRGSTLIRLLGVSSRRISITARPEASTPKCGPLGCEAGRHAQTWFGARLMRIACSAMARTQMLSSVTLSGRPVMGRPCCTCERRCSASSARASSLLRAPLSEISARARRSAFSVTGSTQHALVARSVASRNGNRPISATSPTEAPALSDPSTSPSLVSTSAVPSSSTSMESAESPAFAMTSPAAYSADDSPTATSATNSCELSAKSQWASRTGRTLSRIHRARFLAPAAWWCHLSSMIVSRAARCEGNFLIAARQATPSIRTQCTHPASVARTVSVLVSENPSAPDSPNVSPGVTCPMYTPWLFSSTRSPEIRA
mmetsp:Transcript_99454/g.281509  ORF Transcript_99454/g.281509 Transcript_99454/m.281509 type:complete len:330 (-) Transcript_99454:3212-4201(-)